MGLSFTVAAGPRQRSHSRVRVPRDSRQYFTVSDSRLPQPGGPGPRIYIPQEQGGLIIPPDCVTPIVFKITLRHGPRRKHNLSIVVKACLPPCCVTTAIVSLFVSRSLPCNGSIRHNINFSEEHSTSIFRLQE
jgi:hypothetical protein